MRLPNGEVLMHGTALYDPKKAHEYYLRTRELKGRKKGKGEPTSVKREAGAVDKGKQEQFLNNLPMTKAGMPRQEVVDMIKKVASLSDAQIHVEIGQIRQSKEENADAKIATLEHLMLLRKSSQKSVKQPLAKKPGKSAEQKGLEKAADNAASQVTPAQAKKLLATASKRVTSIKQELADLNNKLKKAMAAARKSAAKEKRGPTASEKSKAARESKKYRDKNKQKIANKAKRASSKSKSKSGSKKDSVADLKKRISEVQGRLDVAVKKQKSLSSAAKNG